MTGKPHKSRELSKEEAEKMKKQLLEKQQQRAREADAKDDQAGDADNTISNMILPGD